MTALKKPPSAPILTNSQARPRAERLATVGAEIWDDNHLLVHLKEIQIN